MAKRPKTIMCRWCRQRTIPKGNSFLQECAFCGGLTNAKRPRHGQMQAICDDLFSLVVRFGSADRIGNVVCVTCGARLHWTMVDAGHFQGRNLKPTRFDEKNVNPQCKDCNGKRCRGEQFKHGVWIDNRWGVGTAASLVSKAKLDGAPYNHGLYFSALANELVKRCEVHQEAFAHIIKIAKRQRAAWIEFFEVKRGNE